MKIVEQFVKLPRKLVEDASLLPAHIKIYASLRSFNNERKNSGAFPARSTIASYANCSIDTVDRAIKALIKNGYITCHRGKRGRSNTYKFIDTCTRAATAPVRLSSCMGAGSMAASEPPQSELQNQNKKPESSTRLLHGGDIASVMENGSIRIKNHAGQWVDYGGGDDGAFQFGDLRGRAALDAARTRYSDKKKYGKMASLPTNGEAPQPPAPQPDPYTTKSP